MSSLDSKPIAKSKSFAHFVESTKSLLQEQESRLKKVEKSLIGQPPDVWERTAKAYQPLFNKAMDSQLQVLERHAKPLTAKEREAEGKYLRSECKSYIEQAPILYRTTVKPRGYQGDSEMMRMVYSNDWQGETLFGKLLHKHSISIPACDAIRNRRALITNELRKQAVSRSQREPLTLLSVACGPAQEIADIFKTPEDFAKFHVTLLDQDSHALGEARQNIDDAEKRCGAKATVRYEKASIGVFLRPTAKRSSLGQFDFIYSMGLYDYLDEKTASKLTNALFDMLKPHGTLLLGNYAKSNPSRIHMQYLGDWPLVYRDEKEFLGLLDPSRSKDVTVGFESSGTQMFLRARKGAEGELSTAGIKARL